MVTETICAIATPHGRGGVGVVRVSGPRCHEIAQGILGTVPSPRNAAHRSFLDIDGTAIDDGLAIFFASPKSFTGEDVLELQGHGGSVVLDLLLRRVIQLGARMARPGEFSERAFLNDKIDLAQAEAIADLIDSQTEAAAKAATRSLQGEFSALIHRLVEGVIHLRMYVESAIDFTDEEIDFLRAEEVFSRLKNLIVEVEAILLQSRQGALLRDGMTLVIAGQPNAGKSSLLNRLAGYDAAIVTDQPGTTRDIVRERIQIDGLPINILDTAGIRSSGDAVEQEGVRRAWDAMRNADRVLLVIDDQRGIESADEAILADLPGHLPVTVVHNKIDVSGRGVELSDDKHIFVSATTEAGLKELRQHLVASVGYHADESGGFIARRRHLEALQEALSGLQRGEKNLLEKAAGELLAEDLRYAQHALSSITGEFTTDDLLGRIFSEFCIGK